MATVTVEEGKIYLAPVGSYSGGSITADHIFEMSAIKLTEDVQRSPIEIEKPTGDPNTNTWEAYIVEIGRAKKHFEVDGYIRDNNSQGLTKHQMREKLEILSSVHESTAQKSELDFVYKNLGTTREHTVTVNKFSVDEVSSVSQTDDPKWDVTLSLIVGTFKG